MPLLSDNNPSMLALTSSLLSSISFISMVKIVTFGRMVWVQWVSGRWHPASSPPLYPPAPTRACLYSSRQESKLHPYLPSNRERNSPKKKKLITSFLFPLSLDLCIVIYTAKKSSSQPSSMSGIFTVVANFAFMD